MSSSSSSSSYWDSRSAIDFRSRVDCQLRLLGGSIGWALRGVGKLGLGLRRDSGYSDEVDDRMGGRWSGLLGAFETPLGLTPRELGLLGLGSLDLLGCLWGRNFCDTSRWRVRVRVETALVGVSASAEVWDFGMVRRRLSRAGPRRAAREEAPSSREMSSKLLGSERAIGSSSWEV